MFFAGVRVSCQAAFSISVNFLNIRKFVYVLKMLIVRHLGTPNSDFNGCHCMRDPVLYTDQWFQFLVEVVIPDIRISSSLEQSIPSHRIGTTTEVSLLSEPLMFLSPRPPSS